MRWLLNPSCTYGILASVLLFSSAIAAVPENKHAFTDESALSMPPASPASKSAPSAGSFGYIDVWSDGIQGCEQTAAPVYFTPGECFYVPFLSDFVAYFVPAKQDGYAIVYYSQDNTTAYLYAYEDAQCQQSSEWSYSSPIATKECGLSSYPNIWPSPVLGPAPSSWPDSQLYAPIETEYPNQTCSVVNVNGLTLGQCYNAGSTTPLSAFCDETGDNVIFVTYAPGSNCEPQHALATREQPTGCDIAAQTSGFICPKVTGPTAPTLPGNSISLTWYDTVDTCVGPVIHTMGYQQDYCVGNTMYHCNLNNNTYTEYTFNEIGCETLMSSQEYVVGCNTAYTTFAQCSSQSGNDPALQSLFDPDQTMSGNSKVEPQIAEY